MSKRRTAYPPAFGEQMVELVRTGRSPKSIRRTAYPPAFGEQMVERPRKRGNSTPGLAGLYQGSLSLIRF